MAFEEVGGLFQLNELGGVALRGKVADGGIRELEFIVQALVLIYGGRDPRLRTANTLVALKRLESCGYMAESGASIQLRSAA